MRVMRRYLDRMMRPRDLVMTYHRVRDPEAFPGAVGLLVTSQALTAQDMERIRALQLQGRELADGDTIRIKR